MNFFLNLFKLKTKKNEPTHDLIYRLSIKEIESFENKCWKLSDKGKYELLILIICLVFRYHQYINKQIFAGYFYEFLLDVRNDYKVSLSKSDTIKLIESRMDIYEVMFNEVKEPGSIDGLIYNILYENSLSMNPTPSSQSDIFKVVSCNMAYSQMHNNVRNQKSLI